jgi:hypothetical protein
MSKPIVEWVHPSQQPTIDRGESTSIWGLVDFFEYNVSYGGADAEGHCIRTMTLKEVKRRVIQMEFINAEATEEELAYYAEEGEFPEATPGNMDYWQNDDGEFIGFTGYYQEYNEEGRNYWNIFGEDKDSNLIVDGYRSEGQQPSMVLLAWAHLESPEIPDILPE